MNGSHLNFEVVNRAVEMSAENARVKVLVRLRPPADPSITASDTIKLFPEQPGLLNIRYCVFGACSSADC